MLRNQIIFRQDVQNLLTITMYEKNISDFNYKLKIHLFNIKISLLLLQSNTKK